MRRLKAIFIPLVAALAWGVAERAMAQTACGYTLGSGIYDKWLQMGGASGVLGCPIMNEAASGRTPQGTTGRWAEFSGSDGGYIVWHGEGSYTGRSFEVHGCIFKLYKSLGGGNSWLGFPVSDEYDAPGGRRSDFEGGYVLWEAQSGRCQAYPSETSGGGSGGSGGDVAGESVAGDWRWRLDCTNKFPNGTGQMQLNLGPDGKYTGTFTAQWGDVRSGSVGEGTQQGNQVTFNFYPGGWTSYLIWKGTILRDGGDLRIEGETFYYGGQDCRFTMYREAGGNDAGSGAGGTGGVCADPRTLALMDEWLAQAVPPQRAGESLRYEPWGRIVGWSSTATNQTYSPPDTRLTRCEWLWEQSPRLRSTNGIGTLREYLEQRRR